MSWVRRYFKRSHLFIKNGKPLKRYHILLPGIVAIMMVTHFSEVLICALFFLLRGVLPDRVSAIYFSIHSYTTLGASSVTLPDQFVGKVIIEIDRPAIFMFFRCPSTVNTS